MGYRGYEKAILAAVVGLSFPVTTLIIAGLSARGVVPAPTEAEILNAIEQMRNGILAAVAVFLAANSPSSAEDEMRLYASRLIQEAQQRGAQPALVATRPEPNRSQSGAASEPEPVPQPTILAVKPLRPAPRPAERTDEDEAG